MTPIANPEHFNLAEFLSEAGQQGIFSPKVDIVGSHDIQASEMLSPVDDFSLDPIVAPQEVLQTAPEDALEDQPVDTCPDLEQVQSSSDEADSPNIPTPDESSADDNVPDQEVAPQDDKPVPDPSDAALEPSKQQSYVDMKIRCLKRSHKLMPIAWPKPRRYPPLRWKYSRFVDTPPKEPTTGPYPTMYEYGWHLSAELDPVPRSAETPWLLDYAGFSPLPEGFRLSRYNAERWRCSWQDMRGARRTDPEQHAIFPKTEADLKLRLQQELRRKA